MRKMKKYNNSSGFTLIELIIVLVILAILAAFTIPAMLGFVGNSKEKLCESARSDCLRYYQAQATEKLPATREEAIPILAKAIQNSYGDATVENNIAKGGCPAGGEYNLAECRFEFENGYYRLKEVPCSVHHDKDSSRPNLDASKSLAEKLLDLFKSSQQSDFIKEFFKENNNSLKPVDEIDLKNIFGEDWNSTINGKPESLYWRPLTMEVNGEKTYIMYANTTNTQDHAQWKGYVVEINGVYYRTTKKNNYNGMLDQSDSLSNKTSFQNSEELEKWIIDHHFEKVI